MIVCVGLSDSKTRAPLYVFAIMLVSPYVENIFRIPYKVTLFPYQIYARSPSIVILIQTVPSYNLKDSIRFPFLPLRLSLIISDPLVV